MSADTILVTAATRVRVRWLTGNAVRITHAPHNSTDFPPDRPWLEDVLLHIHPPAEEESELWPELNADRLRLLGPSNQPLLSEAAPPRLGQKRLSPYLDVDLPKVELRSGLRPVQDGIQISLAIQPDETFYGWGEQFGGFARQSGRLRLKIRDALAPLQRRGHTYSAIPLFFSSRGYGFWLLNSFPSRWRIDPAAGQMVIEADGPGADYIVIYGPTFRRILHTYTALTGRPPLPPRWAFGLWATSYPQDHQESLIQHVEEHRARGLGLDAVILDYHWEEAFHNFRWRKSLIPDPDGLIERLGQMGVRLGLIQTPFVNQRTRSLQKFLLGRLAGNLPPGLENDDERALPEYQEGLEKGYFAHPNARWWFGEGGMVDFTAQNAAFWWTNHMRPLYRQGVSFFKNDDGEYLPDNAHSANGMEGSEYHNLYGFYYGRALYQDMQELTRRGLVYARSVWAGSQRYPALFLGDQKPTFEHIRSTLRAGLSLSLQGFAYWTADTFGLDGQTTPETHMRYAQWALLNPIARYFWRPAEVDSTRFPWSHGPQVEANFRKYLELRYRLLPYLNALAWEAYQTGLPLLRPLALEFPGDEQAARLDDQAMLGPGLMLCPVTEAGAQARRIYLPAGVWHDFWSPQRWQGPGWIDYPAPLDCLPILARGGSLIPFGPVLQHIPDNHAFDRLQLHIWPPYPAEGVLYDDDGRSLAYQNGQFTRTRLWAEADERHVRIHIGPAQGHLPDLPANRQVEVVVHQSPPTRLVLIHREALNGWRYDPQTDETVVQFECSTDQETILILE